MSRKDENTYPAGTLTVRGMDVPIKTDADGQWLAWLNGTKVVAPTRDGLKTALGNALRAAVARVAVPILAKDGPARGAYRVRAGTATGIHSASRNVLVTWADGGKDQAGRWGGSAYLDARTADPAEWQRLLDEANRTAQELHAYEEAHTIDLARTVRAAINAVVAGDPDQADTDED